MAVNISAPQISHPSAGLRASIGSGVIYEGLETMPLSDEDRWNTGAGWTYETGPCPELQISSSGNCVNTRPFAPGTPKVYSGRALNISSQIMCSTWGVDIRGKDGKIDIPLFEQYAKEQFDAQIFAKISAEIWSGVSSRAGGADFNGNRYLARTGSGLVDLTVSGEAVPLNEGIAALDSYLKCCSPEGGLIHVPGRVMDHAGDQSIIFADGDRRRTWNGNDVVSECGYDGRGPGTFGAGPTTLSPNDGTVACIYATSPILVRAAVDVKPLSYVDASLNNAYTTLDGMYMWSWGCCHAAIKVVIPDVVVPE